MANRNKNYNEIMAKKFENLEYAQEYLLYVIEAEGLSLDEAVREVIKSMGLGCFSKGSGLAIQAVSDFVSKRQKWSTDKLVKLIAKVFRLKVKLSLEPLDSNEVA